MKQKTPTTEWIIAAELARRSNRSRAAVTIAEKQGHIAKRKNGKFKWPDVMQQWEDNANVSARSNKDKKNDEKWQEARTRREIAEADMAELELQKK